MTLTYLSLFSGIGGLDLGLDRAGWTCVGQVELDAFCRSVLERHWPEVPRHDDVRTAAAWWLGRGGAAVDLVAGGPPCQPVSSHGVRRGADDPRWGWPWMREVVRVVRPRYVLMENVRGLLNHPADLFGTILADLADLGFDAEWSLLSACSMGAPHTRERLFLMAYPAGDDGQQPLHLQAAVEAGRPVVGAAGGDAWPVGWLPEPEFSRVAHGFPKRLVAPALRAVGNAVVPAVGEFVGRLIAAHALASTR